MNIIKLKDVIMPDTMPQAEYFNKYLTKVIEVYNKEKEAGKIRFLDDKTEKVFNEIDAFPKIRIKKQGYLFVALTYQSPLNQSPLFSTPNSPNPLFISISTSSMFFISFNIYLIYFTF